MSRVLACGLLAALSSCSVGHGSGDIDGTVYVAGCRREGPYELRPTAFFADAPEQLLSIRVQRGSDITVRSDGLTVLVRDAAYVKRELLGVPIAVGVEDAPVELSLYLNESCPAERNKTPVALAAVGGLITFSAVYAPRADDDEVRIAAELTGVRFEDPRNPDRWAELSGQFAFLYVRGSPAQTFP